MRKEPERSLAADERFLVAQEALIACDEAQKAKRKTVKEACAEAVRRYKLAMSEAMSPVLLQERLKTETVSNWLLDVNEALRLQRERRASRAPPTFTEHIHSWTSTYWGYAALVAVLILPLLARHAWVTNKEQEKEKAKLTKKTTQYHYPLRKPAPVGTRQRTRLRSNRSRQAMAT